MYGPEWCIDLFKLETSVRNLCKNVKHCKFLEPTQRDFGTQNLSKKGRSQNRRTREAMFFPMITGPCVPQHSQRYTTENSQVDFERIQTLEPVHHLQSIEVLVDFPWISFCIASDSVNFGRSPQTTYFGSYRWNRFANITSLSPQVLSSEFFTIRSTRQKSFIIDLTKNQTHIEKMRIGREHLLPN